jgi:hypothetical protein
MQECIVAHQYAEWRRKLDLKLRYIEPEGLPARLVSNCEPGFGDTAVWLAYIKSVGKGRVWDNLLYPMEGCSAAVYHARRWGK